jgi:two-component system, chemotaxis family, protein-glutamate methylesterase/glutaminase
MTPARVLIVDDSSVIRKILSGMLASDEAIVVAGTAGNGRQALQKIQELSPDLVTLDIEMPGMNGLETLVEIRKLHPRLPVIMFSTLTERGAAATLDALARGASDYVTKPGHGGGSEADREKVREELIRKIKSFCCARNSPGKPIFIPPVAASRQTQQRVDVVAIGTSTGGPNALTAIIPQLPADFPVPVVVVQHMPPLFTRLLAERLNSKAHLPVCEGKNGARLHSGEVCIAPGNYHMTVDRVGTEPVIGLNQDAQENSCRPAVDVLFRSIARSYGPSALAVVLTGMGSDGTVGAVEVRRAGGEVIVQDENSSVVWGMPGSVVAGGLTNQIFPLNDIAGEMVRRVSIRRSMAAATHD